MIPYTVVRVQKPKQKAPLRNEEVSISFHKPFKLVKTQIQQPSVKKSIVPSVVHIIERKSKKKGTVTRIDLNDKPVHVLQPRKGKKGCRFTHQDLYGDDDLKKEDEKCVEKKEVSVKQDKQEVIDKTKIKQIKIDEKKQERSEKMKQIEQQDVVIIESEEKIKKSDIVIKSKRNLSPKNKINQREIKQENNVHINPIKQEYLSREGKKSLQRNLQPSKEHSLPKEQQIILPEESSFYQEKGKDIKLKRAILSMKGEQQQKPFYQEILIPEQFERKEAKTNALLRRQILSGKPQQSVVNIYKANESLQIYPIEQEYLSREGRKFLQRNLQPFKEHSLPKEQQIILPEESSFYQEKGKDIKLKRAILSMKGEQQQKPFYQEILIPEQFERKEAKTNALLRRQILSGKPQQSVVNIYKANESLQIYPIEQEYLSREGRKSLQRNLQPSKEHSLPKEQQIILPEESSFYQEKGKDIKLKRAILSMKGEQQQKPFYQEILIPEQFERKEAKTNALLRRQILSGKPQQSVVNIYKANESLQIYPIEQEYLSREGRKSLQRNLQSSKEHSLPKEQQIILPEESSFYQEKGKDIKLKRSILSMKGEQQQKPFYQEILIPEQFERKEAKTNALLRRQLQPDLPSPLNSQISPVHYPKDQSQVPTQPSSAVPSFNLLQSQQYFPASNHPAKLKRSLNTSLPLPSIPQMNQQASSLSLSQTVSKLFNVYNPSLYLSSDKQDPTQHKTLSISSSARSLKPHRRPGMHK